MCFGDAQNIGQKTIMLLLIYDQLIVVGTLKFTLKSPTGIKHDVVSDSKFYGVLQTFDSCESKLCLLRCCLVQHNKQRQPIVGWYHS